MTWEDILKQVLVAVIPVLVYALAHALGVKQGQNGNGAPPPPRRLEPPSDSSDSVHNPPT